MEQITELQNSTINFILVEKTKSHWHDFPELASLIESLQALQEPLNVPSLQYLLELARLACQADAEQSNRLFLRLESYFAVAEPPVVAHVLATLILEGGEGYPFPIEHATGWLAWALDYKPELARKGQFVKRLWRAAEGRREEIESLAVQRIVSTLIKKQQEQRTRLMNKDLDATNRDGGANRNWAGRYHDIIYMLHCGPLADQGLQLWDEESVLNALVRIRDGSNQRAFENQLLILVNLLDRLFSWIESKDVEENKEQLKQRVALYTKTPELLAFAIDTVVAYLDGRWIKGDIKEDGAVRSKTLSTSLLDINREREPIHYATTDAQGSFGFSESKNAIRGRSLKEREIPQRHDRGQAVREFEIVDLVARCMEGHDSDVYEQLLRRLMLHIAMQVDTVMISATAAAMKHAAQQRDKILLRLTAENPVYRRIMVSAMNKAHWSVVSICLPVIQGMLRCSIAHWNTCKNSSPKSYPKELDEAIWLAQLAEQTGLIPDPINQATVLFPLVESKDVGLILEQCYYILLVRNADVVQQQHQQQHAQQQQQQKKANNSEISLLRRIIFKHATKTFHLMPLFTVGHQAPSAADRTSQ